MENTGYKDISFHEKTEIDDSFLLITLPQRSLKAFQEDLYLKAVLLLFD